MEEEEVKGKEGDEKEIEVFLLSFFEFTFVHFFPQAQSEKEENGEEESEEWLKVCFFF